MMKRLLLLVIVNIYLLPINIWAAETIVPPGDGTLQAAINAASTGDTLLLTDGGYEGEVTINRNITIKPLNRATTAVVSGRVIINGSNIDVTLQGLYFTNIYQIYLSKALSVNILENNFTGGGIRGTGFDYGTLNIIGNTIIDGDIEYISVNGAYIAGNTITGGIIDSDAYVWIVGNHIVSEQPWGRAVIYIDGDSPAFIIGNYVRCEDWECIGIKTSNNSLISNNVIEIEDTEPTSGSYGHQYGIVAGGGNVKIRNNIIRGIPTNPTRQGSALHVTAPISEITGNIITHWISDDDACYITSNPAQTSNNIWHDYSGNCPQTNNMSTAPLFIDESDYLLELHSPAIDSGPVDGKLSDLDQTRNDIGIYGGPWSKGQYDIQRNPNNLAPFVYPKIMPDTFFNGGIFEVKAIGVARLR